MSETSPRQTHPFNATPAYSETVVTRPCASRVELPGDEVVIHKDGHRLIVEPVKKPNTLAEGLVGASG
jgi:hypothetical protein